jgi:D-serine deaminase-like pyridoxal phosphate-dependent protein
MVMPGADDTPAAGDYDRYRRAIAGRPLPLAFVDLDAFDHNAGVLARLAGSKPIRAATKSLRCPALLRRVLARGPAFRGLMAWAVPEAAFLSVQGFDDILVAYPSAQPAELQQAAELVKAGKRLCLTVDCAAHLELASRAALAAGTTLPVCLDLDVSTDYGLLYFGTRRSPLRAPEQLQALARAVLATPGLRLDGILAYEGQLAGVPDDVAGARGRSAVVRALKRDSGRRVRRRRAQAVAAVRALAPELRFVNGGGTGSLGYTSGDASVTELTAGSGLFAPALFDGYRDLALRPAAAYALAICRVPEPGVYTCQGGGYVASGAAGSDRLPRPWLPAGAALIATEGAGEVQTPVRYAGAVPLAPGDPLLFRHAKAGELAERFRTLHLIADGRVVDEVPTYRGQGLCLP